MIRRRYLQASAGTTHPHPKMIRSFNRRVLGLSVTLAAAFGMTRVAAAQQPKEAPIRITEEKRGLFSKAKVSGDSAQKIALARIANGRITQGELEEEDGKLIYSFDIKVAGKPGIEEVHVDARTGAILKTEHEDDTDAAPKPAAKPKSKP